MKVSAKGGHFGIGQLGSTKCGLSKLSTFSSYRIHEDEELSALFREEGCGSLLDAKNLQAIAAEYTPDRDKSALQQYLSKH